MANSNREYYGGNGGYGPPPGQGQGQGPFAPPVHGYGNGYGYGNGPGYGQQQGYGGYGRPSMESERYDDERRNKYGMNGPGGVDAAGWYVDSLLENQVIH